MTTTRRIRRNREVRRPGGTTIRYTASGPEQGPALALIHGWACDRRDFDAVTGHLPDGHRVLAIDLAEHGESRSAREVWTIEEFARDVAAVLEAESVDKVVVAGHSLGGAVAVEVGRLLPDRVSHVVALDALHYLSLFPAISEEQAEAILRVFREDFAAGGYGAWWREARRPGPTRLSKTPTSRRWQPCVSPPDCVPSKAWCAGTWTRRCVRRGSRSPCSRSATSSRRRRSTATATGSTSCSSIWAATISPWSRRRTRRSSWPASLLEQARRQAGGPRPGSAVPIAA
ncbi:alpha/beta fold hydrolase [Nonomuraea salmonea]|uniref:alpha/beta fold hydrolase n=1 Tax=Nonomuraea salmonea TaxID=46181 RepID=UPI003CD05C34